MAKRFKAAIIGGSGYGGAELPRRLPMHPDVEPDNYSMAGYLFSKTFDVTDRNVLADLNAAIWKIFYPKLYISGHPTALNYYEEGLSHPDFDWSNVMYVLTPTPEPSYAQKFYAQEFLIRINPVPEPATMILLASGLVGLAGLRKKFTRS